MNLICTLCGWVHFGVTRAYAEAEVESFNAYLASLDEKSRKFWGPVKEDGTEGEPTPASIERYEHCHCCGASYTHAREALPEELSYGSTIGPLIIPETI